MESKWVLFCIFLFCSVNVTLGKNLMEGAARSQIYISLYKILPNCSSIGFTTVPTNICDVLFLKNKNLEMWSKYGKMLECGRLFGMSRVICYMNSILFNVLEYLNIYIFTRHQISHHKYDMPLGILEDWFIQGHQEGIVSSCYLIKPWWKDTGNEILSCSLPHPRAVNVSSESTHGPRERGPHLTSTTYRRGTNLADSSPSGTALWASSYSLSLSSPTTLPQPFVDPL